MSTGNETPQRAMPSDEEIKQFVEAALSQGGALLLGDSALQLPEELTKEYLEEYPTGSPPPDELQWRRYLYRLARHALTLSRDEHPLCVQALETLKAFNHGQAGYRDLALARARLEGRTAAALCVGLPHERANAATTLACFHAVNPDLIKAIRLTKYFYRRTLEFVQARLDKERKAL